MKKADFIKTYINCSSKQIAASLMCKGWQLAGMSPESTFLQKGDNGLRLIIPLADRLKPELIEFIGDRIERNSWKPQGKKGGLNGFCYPVRIRASSSGGFYITSKAFPEMFAQTDDDDDILIMARKVLQSALLLRNALNEPLPFGKKFEHRETDELFFLLPQYVLERLEAEAEAEG